MPSSSPQRHKGLRVVSRPGTAVLYLRGTVRGRSVYETTGIDDPALAEEARAAREAELFRAAVHGIEAKPRVTFAQAALAYLTRPQEGRPISTHTKMAMARIAKHFGDRLTCDQINQAQIDAAGRALCRPGSKAVTIGRMITTPVKAVLNYAARRGWCPPPAFETARGGRQRTDWFTPAEAEALIAGADDYLRPLLTFLFCSGARLGEAVALEWADVDLRHSRCTLRETKNGADRIIEMPPRAVAALASLPGDRIGRVFLHPEKEARELLFRRDGAVTLGRGSPEIGRIDRQKDGWMFTLGQHPPSELHPTRVRAKLACRAAVMEILPAVRMAPYRLTEDTDWGGAGGQIRSPWNRAITAAKIGRTLTPHHTRHSWATWHYCVHKDLVRLRIDGGWNTTAMCERYTKLAPAGIRADIEAFWRGSAAPDQTAIVRVA